LEVGEPTEIDESKLDGLVVASSKRPVRESLQSSAPFLMITDQSPDRF
jgi:hypothetical protein